MADFDPIPPVNPVFRGLMLAAIILAVGLVGWALIGFSLWFLAPGLFSGVPT
jgi:hypothetical protein